MRALVFLLLTALPVLAAEPTPLSAVIEARRACEQHRVMVKMCKPYGGKERCWGVPAEPPAWDIPACAAVEERWTKEAKPHIAPMLKQDAADACRAQGMANLVGDNAASEKFGKACHW